MLLRRNLWVAALAGSALAAGAAWLAGCGGAGGGPTWSPSGPSYQASGTAGPTSGPARSAAMQPAGIVRGVVEVPVRPSGFERPIALLDWITIGSPACAEQRVSRTPLAGARVYLVDRATGEHVSDVVTTDVKGQFRIEKVTPSNRFSVVATDGQVTVEAVLPPGDAARQDVSVTLNEATTVGAAAALLAEKEGLGPEAATTLAGQITQLQESYQAEHPSEMPDLSRASDAQDRARKHLLRTADAAVAASLETKDKADAWRAVAAGQILARTNFKLPRKVILVPLQAEAIATAVVNKEERSVPVEKMCAALKKAGVKDKDGKAIAAGQVGTALDTLRKALPSLKDVKADKLPVVVAVLVAEQADAPFQITTREQMKAFLKELVGEVPAVPAKGKAGTATARGAKPSAPAKDAKTPAKPAEEPAASAPPAAPGQ